MFLFRIWPEKNSSQANIAAGPADSTIAGIPAFSTCPAGSSALGTTTSSLPIFNRRFHAWIHRVPLCPVNAK